MKVGLFHAVVRLAACREMVRRTLVHRSQASSPEVDGKQQDHDSFGDLAPQYGAGPWRASHETIMFIESVANRPGNQKGGTQERRAKGHAEAASAPMAMPQYTQDTKNRDGHYPDEWSREHNSCLMKAVSPMTSTMLPVTAAASAASSRVVTAGSGEGGSLVGRRIT